MDRLHTQFLDIHPDSLFRASISPAIYQQYRDYGANHPAVMPITAVEDYQPQVTQEVQSMLALARDTINSGGQQTAPPPEKQHPALKADKPRGPGPPGKARPERTFLSRVTTDPRRCGDDPTWTDLSLSDILAAPHKRVVGHTLEWEFALPMPVNPAYQSKGFIYDFTQKETMKLSILALFSLWLTVAAACAAETPVPTPTPTPTPTIEPPLKENLEPLIAYPDIGYQQADLEKWLKVIQEIGLEQHPGVTRIYTATDSGGYGNIRIIVSSREHIGPVMEQVELAGVPFNIAQVLLDSPWHR